MEYIGDEKNLYLWSPSENSKGSGYYEHVILTHPTPTDKSGERWDMISQKFSYDGAWVRIYVEESRFVVFVNPNENKCRKLQAPLITPRLTLPELLQKKRKK